VKLICDRVHGYSLYVIFSLGDMNCIAVYIHGAPRKNPRLTELSGLLVHPKCRLRSRFRPKHVHAYRPTRGSMSPYNTAGLSSEDSEEVATQIAKNCRSRQPHSHLTPQPRGTPTNIPINLIFP